MREDAIYRALGSLELELPELPATDAARLAAMAKTRAGMPVKRPMRRWKLALLAAAILTLAACATVAFSSGWFSSYTPPGDVDKGEQLRAEIGQPIGQSETVGEYTVTLLGVISDGYDAVLAFSVRHAKGETLDAMLEFSENYLISDQKAEVLDQMEQAGYPQEPWLWYATQELRAETRYDEGDSEQLFTARYPLTLPWAETGVQQGSYHFALGTLTNRQGEVLQEGPWTFELALSTTDQSRTLSLNQSFAEGAMQLESLTITPLNLILHFSGTGQPSLEAVRLKEGQELFCGKKGVQLQGEEQPSGCSWSALERVVDPAGVQAVRIDGVWYLLEENGEGCRLVQEA